MLAYSKALKQRLTPLLLAVAHDALKMDDDQSVSGKQANKFTLIAAKQTAVGAIPHITTMRYLCQWRCLALPDVTGAAIFINRARTTRSLSSNERTNSISASPGSGAHSRHVRYVYGPARAGCQTWAKKGAGLTGRPHFDQNPHRELVIRGMQLFRT
jgi:hypothetical protein